MKLGKLRVQDRKLASRPVSSVCRRINIHKSMVGEVCVTSLRPDRKQIDWPVWRLSYFFSAPLFSQVSDGCKRWRIIEIEIVWSVFGALCMSG